MAERTFKSYFDEWIKAGIELQVKRNQVEHTRTIVGLKELRNNIGILERKVKWFEAKMNSFGLGTIIEIRGYVNVQVPNRLRVSTSKPFRILLANITEADAKEYFEKIVKLKYKNIEDKTIQFKQLPTGMLQILQ